MSKITGKINYKEVLKGDTGYTFEPHVTVDGILYWTNNGNLENPLPVNLHGKQGFMFIPHVDREGNLSWTNTGELENPPTVNIKGDKGYFYTPHISQDGILTWSNNGDLENPQPFNISDLILNEVKESRVDTTGKTFSKLKERLDSDFKKLSESIKNNDTKDEVVQARTATTGENFMSLDDRIDHEIMRLREKIEVTMLEQEDKESHDISNTIDGMSSDMVIKGKTIKLNNGEIKSFGQEEDKISILSKSLSDIKFEQGTYDKSQNTVISVTTRITSNLIEGNFKSILNNNLNFKEFMTIIFAFDSDKRFISSTGDWSDNLETSNLPLNTKYIRIVIKRKNEKTISPNDIANVYFGESNKKDILLSEYGFEEGLRGLNNIVYDELNDTKNMAIKRIDKRVFNGNETWYNSTVPEGTDNETIRFQTKLPNAKDNNGDKFIANYPTGSGGTTNIDAENIQVSNGVLYIRVKKSKLETQDLNGFVKWLKSNPLTIYFELKELIETPLNENINVKTFNDKTYVNFENSIKGTSSFKVPVNTNKLINDLKFEKEDLKEKFNNLTNEFENFKTYMIQTLPYKEV